MRRCVSARYCALDRPAQYLNLLAGIYQDDAQHAQMHIASMQRPRQARGHVISKLCRRYACSSQSNMGVYHQPESPERSGWRGYYDAVGVSSC